MSLTPPATSVQVFTVTCPAGTPLVAPVVQETTFPIGEVVHLEVDVPTGHAGVTGLQLRIAGGQAIPLTQGSWLIGDGQTFAYDLTGYLDSGYWAAYMYNTGIYDHSWQIRYSISNAVDEEPIATATVIPSPVIV